MYWIISVRSFLNSFFSIHAQKYFFYLKATFQNSNERTLVDAEDFKFTPLTEEDPPSKFLVSIKSSSYNFNLQFEKIEGVFNDPALNNDIYIQNDGEELTKVVTSNVVGKLT